MLFSGTSFGVLTCDCSFTSSDEMLSRTDWCYIVVGFFGYYWPSGYLWPCRWHFLSPTVLSEYSLKNMSTASLCFSSHRLMTDWICKRISRVSSFIDCCSLEKMHHKNENTLPDSALDKGTARQISRTCNKLWIPKPCPLWEIIGQHFSEDDFEMYLMMWSCRTSSSSFKWLILQLLVSKKDLKYSTMTFTSS